MDSQAKGRQRMYDEWVGRTTGVRLNMDQARGADQRRAEEARRQSYPLPAPVRVPPMNVPASAPPQASGSRQVYGPPIQGVSIKSPNASKVWFKFVDDWFEGFLGKGLRKGMILIGMALVGSAVGLQYGRLAGDPNAVPYATVGAIGGLLLLPLLQMAIKLMLVATILAAALAAGALIVYSIAYFWQ